MANIPCPDPCPVITTDLTFLQNKAIIFTDSSGQKWRMTVTNVGAISLDPTP